MPGTSATGWKRLRLLITTIVVAAFLLLMPRRFTAPARVLFNEATGPAQTAAFQGAGEVLTGTGTLSEALRKQDRESALAREVVKLRNSNAALADRLAAERRVLESIVRLQVQRFEARAVSAAVSSYDTSALSRSITVRAGSFDGVGQGMAVTADGALVGLVTEVGPFQSRVRLVTDARSAIPCRMSRTRDLCVLQGTGGDACVLDWLPREAFVEPGDVAVSCGVTVGSAQAPPVPEGVPTATVREVERDAMRPLFLKVNAAPRVNLNRLESVEVLVPLR